MKGSWRRIGSGLQRSSHSAAVINDTLFLFGGEVNPREPVPNAVHALPLSSLQASDVFKVASAEGDASRPSARVGAASTSLGSKLYVWGGRGGKDMSQPLDEHDGLWEFDGSEWSYLKTTGDAPENRSYHTLTADPERRCLYLHAGCPSKGRTGTLHRLDLESLTWSKLPDGPGPGRGGTVIIRLHDGKIARFGGFAGHELGGLDLFDPTTEAWSSVDVDGPKPEARSVYSFVALDPVAVKGERVVAVMAHGEREGAPAHLGHAGAGNFHSDVWALLEKGEGCRWQEVQVEGDQPEARGWGATAVWQNQLVMHGGLNTKNERLDDAWLLTLS